jgi:hypothetical protein
LSSLLRHLQASERRTDELSGKRASEDELPGGRGVLAATGEPWVSGGDEPLAGWLAAGGLELAGGSGASVRWQPQLDWSCLIKIH